MTRSSEAHRIGALVQVRIEVPRLSFIKRRPDGRVHFVSPLPTPFNYGSVPDTLSPDGDPLDALVLGPRQRSGSLLEGRVVAVVRFVDGGLEDPKLVVRCDGRPLDRWTHRRIEAFFRVYALAKRFLDRDTGGRGGRFLGIDT